MRFQSQRALVIEREQKEWIFSSKNSTVITKIFIFISNLQDLSQKLPFSCILLNFEHFSHSTADLSIQTEKKIFYTLIAKALQRTATRWIFSVRMLFFCALDRTICLFAMQISLRCSFWDRSSFPFLSNRFA